MNDKKFFEQTNTQDENIAFIPKLQFHNEQNEIEIDPIDSQHLTDEWQDDGLESMLQPKPRWWKSALIITITLFLGATIAQSIQWLLDTWQQHQWIYFVFAIVSCATLGLGLFALLNEYRRIIKLSKHMALQEKTADKNLIVFDAEQSEQLCLNIADEIHLARQNPTLKQWQQQITPAHSGQEVAYLFSRNVLQSFDKQAINLITRNAIESGVIVAISPLALVDMLFISWRNISLINQIAKLYGIELGYFSRLRLFKMVLLNIAFAGATELVQEIGMDWLSQDIAAKLSARAAQGIGVGLLTARLGIKAMEFCRPLHFQANERPRLTDIHRELLTQIKKTVLSPLKQKEKV